MQALHIVSNKPRNYFDLIVLDINMPIMGGLEACERIYNYLSQESSFFGILYKNPSCGGVIKNSDFNLNSQENRTPVNDITVKERQQNNFALAFRSSKVEPKLQRNYFEYEDSESGE